MQPVLGVVDVGLPAVRRPAESPTAPTRDVRRVEVELLPEGVRRPVVIAERYVAPVTDQVDVLCARKQEVRGSSRQGSSRNPDALVADYWLNRSQR